jgi:hypothetical protein
MIDVMMSLTVAVGLNCEAGAGSSRLLHALVTRARAMTTNETGGEEARSVLFKSILFKESSS